MDEANLEAPNKQIDSEKQISQPATNIEHSEAPDPETKNPDDKKPETTGASVVFFAIYILVTIPVILGSLIFVIFDGFCSGGYFCSRPPGFAALNGAIVIAAVVTSYVFWVRKIDKKPLQFRYLLLLPILAAAIYFMRLGDPSELWRLNPPRTEIIRTDSTVEYEYRDIEVKNQWFKVKVNFDTKELYVYVKNDLDGEREHQTILTDEELYKIRKIADSSYLDEKGNYGLKNFAVALGRIAGDMESAASICGDDCSSTTMRNAGDQELNEIIYFNKSSICGDDEYCRKTCVEKYIDSACGNSEACRRSFMEK